MLSKIKYPLLLLSLILILTAAGSEAQNEIAKITFILGEASVSHNDGKGWEDISFNAKIFAGDIIKTGAESRCEITLRDNTVIRIGENSEFKFDNVNIEAGDISGNAKLSLGSIWSNLQKIKAGDEPISVKTPTSVMAVRGTIYRVDAGADSTTSVLVYEGALDVKLTEELKKQIQQQDERKPGPPKQLKGPKQVPGPYEVTLEEWMRIVAGMQINIRKDGKYHSFQFNSEQDAQSDWVKWNLERDEYLKR